MIVGYIIKTDLKKMYLEGSGDRCCNPKRQQHPKEGTQEARETPRPERIVHIVTCIFLICIYKTPRELSACLAVPLEMPHCVHKLCARLPLLSRLFSEKKL